MRFTDFLGIELANRGLIKQASLNKRAGVIGDIWNSVKGAAANAYNSAFSPDLPQTEYQSALSEKLSDFTGGSVDSREAHRQRFSDAKTDATKGRSLSEQQRARLAGSISDAGGNYRVDAAGNPIGVGVADSVEAPSVWSDISKVPGAAADAVGAGYDAYADAVHKAINPDEEGRSDLSNRQITARTTALQAGRILNDPEERAKLRPDQVADLERKYEAAMEELGGGVRRGAPALPRAPKGSAIDDPERARAAQEKIRARQRQYQADAQASEAAVDQTAPLNYRNNPTFQAFLNARNEVQALRQRFMEAKARGETGNMQRLMEQRRQAQAEYQRLREELGDGAPLQFR